MAGLYLDFPLTNGSRICVQRHEDRMHMPNMRADGLVPDHAHEFYEIVLIMRNSCRHVYQQDETTLLPGDLFMIPPHRPHMLQFTEDVLYYNCQFFADALSGEWMEDVQSLTYDRLKENIGGSGDYFMIDRQGILHLNPEESAETADILELILKEQISTFPDSERMKRVLLCLLLARIKRIRDQRFFQKNGSGDWKEKIVHDTLAAFEKGLDQDWDMTEVAAGHNLSAGYFRSIFREVTGMPPRQFLNQIRINHAVDLIQHQGASIYDAACSIGIHDLNYFSRLCRQLTGYPPSHFR